MKSGGRCGRRWRRILVPGDVTTLATVPEETRSHALMVAREPLVAAGLIWPRRRFWNCARRPPFSESASDGQRVPAGFALLKIVDAPARAVLSAERVALNFAQRLSGVATLTAQYVDAVSSTGARHSGHAQDHAGLRRLEKYAVVCGGGMNHRFRPFRRAF
jgi:nicotinate-nucleotide pyrophosphorylase (carboxylating)